MHSHALATRTQCSAPCVHHPYVFKMLYSCCFRHALASHMYRGHSPNTVWLLLDANGFPAPCTTRLLGSALVYLVEIVLFHIAGCKDSGIRAQVVASIGPAVTVPIAWGKGPITVVGVETHAVEQVVILNTKIHPMTTPM